MGCCFSSKGAAPPPPPDLFDNPFNAVSWHHRPIGTGAVYAGDNHAFTLSWNLENYGNLNVAGTGFGVGFFKNAASDPVKTVVFSNDVPDNVGMPWTGHVPVIPYNFDTESCVVILDFESGLAQEFRRWRWHNGAPSASGRRAYSLADEGYGDNRVGFSATGGSVLLGLTRGAEINSNADPIGHVMSIACTYRDPPIKMARTFVWPAIGRDSACNDPQNCTGVLPYGTIAALPQNVWTDAFIAGRGLSTMGVRLAKQLRNYGVRIVDGSAGTNGRADQSVTTAKKTEFQDQMRLIFPSCRVIMNVSENEAATGGGTPIAPNTGA